MQKQLTQNAVFLAMSFLIEANGSTTTLEVKNMLRDHGYYATQDEVSNIMSLCFDENDTFLRTNENGGYYTYTTIESVQNVGTTDDDTTVDVDIADDDTDVVIFTGNSKRVVSNDDNAWVVFHKDENECEQVHVYKGAFTRDFVRNTYAKINKVRIQDTRSKRYHNYIK
jgi:hypothetical protein